MALPRDPTDPIRKEAVSFPGVAKGTSCNQASFKAGNKEYGFKAMFKLDRSIPQAS